MTITLHQICDDYVDGKTKCNVTYQEQHLDCYVFGTSESLVPFVGKNFTVELDYGSIVQISILESFEDCEDSGVVQISSSEIQIRGRIHNIVPDVEDQFIDIYLCKGPNFLVIQASEIPDVKAEVGMPIEVVVTDLCFYPNNL